MCVVCDCNCFFLQFKELTHASVMHRTICTSGTSGFVTSSTVSPHTMEVCYHVRVRVDILGSTCPGSGGQGRRRCGGGRHWEETPCPHYPVACSGQTRPQCTHSLTNIEIQPGLKTRSPERQSDAFTNCVYESIPCTNPRAPVAGRL